MIHEAYRRSTMVYITRCVSLQTTMEVLLIRNNSAQPETDLCSEKQKTNKKHHYFSHKSSARPMRRRRWEGRLRLWVNNLKRNSNDVAEPRRRSDNDDRASVLHLWARRARLMLIGGGRPRSAVGRTEREQRQTRSNWGRWVNKDVKQCFCLSG